MDLTRKYRPRRLSQVVGQDAVIRKLKRRLARPGWVGGAIALVGKTGVGKTSIAWALAGELGCGEYSVLEMDGDKCNVDAVHDLERTLGMGTIDSRDGWRVVIVNEFDAMSPKAVVAWMTLLERLPRRRVVVFTSNDTRTDLFGNLRSKAFLDRCKCYTLTNQGLCTAFARLARKIASREGLNGQPLSEYEKLAKRCGNSMRAMLQRIDDEEMLDLAGEVGRP